MKRAATVLLACSLIPDIASGRLVRPAVRPALPDAVARACPPGSIAYRDGSGSAMRCVAGPGCQPPLHVGQDGVCTCPPGSAAYRDGVTAAGLICVAAPDCPSGQQRDVRGQCRCPDGGVPYRDGSGTARCLPAVPCPPGASRDASGGACVCPPGSILYREGQSAGLARCVPARSGPNPPSIRQPVTLQPSR